MATVHVFLYDEGSAEQLDIAEIAGYLTDQLPSANVEVRGNPFTLFLFQSNQDTVTRFATRIASGKVQAIDNKPTPDAEPLHGEIEYEKRRILGKTTSFGVIYDGFHLQRVFFDLIPAEERTLDLVHIVFTNRLIATWDDGDKRYHLRTSVYGIPSIISTTGLIEAPAKPREYYLLKQQYQRLRKDITELKENFQGRFIDYGDQRLTEVAKGYAMQAVFAFLIGDPFCRDKGCRLYNAHWQEELIHAQLESEYEFCPYHTRILAEKQSERTD